MRRLKKTKLDFCDHEVILTEGMYNAATGERIYGVFANERDACSVDADARVLHTLSASDLTPEQIEIARRNSERL